MSVQIGIEPCGFCGREDTCITRLVKKGTSSKISSSCRYFYASMSYAAAAKSTKSTPCTNIPIHCPLCPPSPSGNPVTIWKYNAIVHLHTHHLTKENCLPDLPPAFMIDMHISKAEESAMGVGEESTDLWRDEYQVPDSDDIQEAKDGLSARAVQKRARAQSTQSVVEIDRRRKTSRTG